ncbi:hypothetical protein ASE63_07960 [Bosea sp. Root381]|nr:hypothetical protein ASE63_07960 [Bosea sp. Root381]
MLRPGPLARAVERAAVTACLDRVEGLRCDDGEVRHRPFLMLGGVIDARDTPAGRRILDHADPIPDQSPGIERVEQDAVAAVAVPVDRHRGPEPAARGRHGFVVEAPGDLTRARAGEVLVEDAADDGRLGLDDLELARLARDGAVAIGPAAGAAAVPDDAGQAAPYLLREALQEQRRHRALEPDMHLADLAVGDGEELHAGELHRLVKPGDVGEVAREPVEILGQDRIELAGKRQPDQALIVRAAMDRRARSGAIGKDVGDRQAKAGGMRTTEYDLVLDRAVTLQVG